MTEPTEQPTETAEAQETTDEMSVDHWKQMSRKWEARAKENSAKLKEAEPIVSQWKALEEASKTETQRAQEEATRWQNEAQTWRTAAVSSRVETLAASDFADPSDALNAVDPAKYLDAGGQINEDAIKADLAALLERKPHWRRAADTGPATPRLPAPNPAQGSGANGAGSNDPAQQFAALIRGQLGP